MYFHRPENSAWGVRKVIDRDNNFLPLKSIVPL
jgi:hypothetical protein